MNLRPLLDSRILFIGAALVFVSGCGDDVMRPAYTPPVDPGQPPPPPENAPFATSPGGTYAISKLKLGRNDSNGNIDSNVWKSMGYNLDHTVTTTTSAGVMVGETVCARIDGAAFKNIADGNDGRDNAFGSGVMAMIAGVTGKAEELTNDLVRLGKHTLLLDLPVFGDSPPYLVSTARLYEGRAFVDSDGTPAVPLWDGTDVWPVAPESVVNGALEKPLASAIDGYVIEDGEGGTYVGHFEGSIVLTLDVLGLPDEQGILLLRIYEPLITMRLSADLSRVESGTLAGFIDTAEIDAETARLVGVFDKDFCGMSPTAVALRQQVRQSSDILRHGQKDKTKPCDSMSIGVEFEAVRAQLGKMTTPAEPPPDACVAP